MFFAAEYKTSPFEILRQDIDDFIVVVNYLLNKGESGGVKKDNKKDVKIHVNDKTATGGWW